MKNITPHLLRSNVGHSSAQRLALAPAWPPPSPAVLLSRCYFSSSLPNRKWTRAVSRGRALSLEFLDVLSKEIAQSML
ncbi:hypothetical protein QQF64_031967 [Cirrhinus molitorella]|uniref:Uncharacterized protein n=1 Tax=Cirrhinus molitorella TaxID=172907 RepID=A0ABR3MYH5_9TELE